MTHAGFSLVEECRLHSCGQWDLRSRTREGTRVPCTGRQILNYWTTGEVPFGFLQAHTSSELQLH